MVFVTATFFLSQCYRVDFISIRNHKINFTSNKLHCTTRKRYVLLSTKISIFPEIKSIWELAHVIQKWAIPV